MRDTCAESSCHIVNHILGISFWRLVPSPCQFELTTRSTDKGDKICWLATKEDLLAGNEGEGVDTLNDASAVIDEAFVLPASVLTALEA